MQPTQSSSRLSLEELLATLRTRWLLIALCLVVTTTAAFVFSINRTKEYTATASLVFNNTQLSQQVAGLQAASGGDPQAQQGTNVRLVQLGGSAAATAKLLGRGLTRDEVEARIKVSSEANSNIVQVSASSASPKFAANL